MCFSDFCPLSKIYESTLTITQMNKANYQLECINPDRSHFSGQNNNMLLYELNQCYHHNNLWRLPFKIRENSAFCHYFKCLNFNQSKNSRKSLREELVKWTSVKLTLIIYCRPLSSEIKVLIIIAPWTLLLHNLRIHVFVYSSTEELGGRYKLSTMFRRGSKT